MPKARLPPNEDERLAELQSFEILDTPEEQAFDDIVQIASIIFDMPISLISLVDEARQFFKARVGLDATETHRDLAFCAHTILEPKVMVIEDALADERFVDNELVTADPHIRFYAGAPLVTDLGNRLGTLCLIDRKPRSLTAKEEEILQLLANRVITEMKLRKANQVLRKTRKNIDNLFATLSDGVLAVNGAGEITFVDKKAQRLFAIDEETSLGRNWEDVLKLRKGSADTIRSLLTQNQQGPAHLKLDGPYKEVEIRKLLVPGSPGEAALILSDVTELRKMRAILTTETVCYGIVGRAPAMRQIIQQIEQVASLDIPVLISGETGTGKDLVANAIHEISPRDSGPFVAINCGALTESILTSQLFGHKRGAFTGAIDDQKGLFEAGSGGTVFLDEIGDMPLDLQASLLRVLDSKEVVRLGESQPRRVDFRLVSASNKDLQQLMAEGLFREDLFYRIRGLDIRMPPLRHRREDIPLLLNHFAAIDAMITGTEPAHFTNNAIATLMRYRWPGNVRQLRSAVSYAVLHSSRDTLRLTDLPPEITADSTPAKHAANSSNGIDAPARLSPKEELLKALEVAEGNRSQAAKILGISRATLYRRLERHGINS